MRKVLTTFAMLVVAVAVTSGPAGAILKRDQSQANTPAAVPADQILEVVHSGFGSKVRVEQQSKPFYLLGDFNGDGHQDVAVLVKPEEAWSELKKHGVRYISVNPYSATNGSQLDLASATDDSCLGVAIVHGSAKGWSDPAAKYLFYECFSPFRLVRKGQKIRRKSRAQGATPTPKGDALQLDLENGGRTLVYWDGKTYRGFGQRGAD